MAELMRLPAVEAMSPGISGIACSNLFKADGCCEEG